MNVLRALIVLLILYASSAFAWQRGIHGVADSQLNPNFLGGSEGITINALKWAAGWTYNDNSANPGADELDSNGYPKNGANGFSHGGYKVNQVSTSSQFARPGNWVVIGSGRGQVSFSDDNATNALVTCSGAPTGLNCNNAACTSFTGQISGTVLTVTVASSCSLVAFQPISNGSTVANQFGVPTIIIGSSTQNANLCSPSCTGAGGTGTYAVNFSQSIASSSFVPGVYEEVSASSEIVSNGGSSSWSFFISATDATNPLSNMALLHKNDLLAYARGQLAGVLFKQRVQQGNFAILRDLNTAHTNLANVTTWATRKPAAYWSYVAPEQRASLYAGATTYALNAGSNDYAVNLGVALPVDKQTVCVRYSATTTNSTVTFSIDNGVTKHTALAAHGASLDATQAASGQLDSFVYDATLQTWFASAFSGPSRSCLTNYMPPEAFVEINQELGTTPWIVEPLFASDPITDYMTQYAIYLSGFSWPNPPMFEIPDETWNCSGEGVANYPTLKSRAYIAADATWSANASGHVFCGGSGDINNWTGKAGSLLGQAIRQVSNTFPVIVGVQTVQNAGAAWNANILSTSYIGQNAGNIPTQSGCAGASALQTSCPAPFTKTAAYLAMAGSTSAAAGITIANYWGLNQQQSANSGLEVGQAYCYFFQSGGCASQASIMTAYFATQGITQAGAVPAVSTLWSSWRTFANTCAGGSSCTPMTVYNYEGGYDAGSASPDITQSVTSATNAATAVLAVASNGCVAGQVVALSGLSGGTWSTAAGSYTVQASGTDASHCAVNLNSTGLGTLSSATLTYTNSADYVSYLRVYSWMAPDFATNTTLLYNTIASASGACSPACSKFPSQFNFASSITGNASNCCWLAWAQDLYGYVQVASCSACTETGGNMTLAGTVTGIFTPGLSLIGGGISGATITGACSKTGALPAGANSGDVCPISNGSTVGANAMNGMVAPKTNYAGNSTTSPVKAWGAICRWNNNQAQCDGL